MSHPVQWYFYRRKIWQISLPEIFHQSVKVSILKIVSLLKKSTPNDFTKEIHFKWFYYKNAL